jgi:hypothetical protein
MDLILNTYNNITTTLSNDQFRKDNTLSWITSEHGCEIKTRCLQILSYFIELLTTLLIILYLRVREIELFRGQQYTWLLYYNAWRIQILVLSNSIWRSELLCLTLNNAVTLILLVILLFWKTTKTYIKAHRLWCL